LKSNLISKSESSSILTEISIQWKIDIPKIKNLEVHNITNNVQILTGKEFIVLKLDETYIPFLTGIQILEKFPYVMVDMGAVKFMCNGANVMRPGIKNYSEFEQGQIVCVVEESQKKFLSVGKALVSSSKLDMMKKGIVLKNLHYISDEFWEIGKTIKD